MTQETTAWPDPKRPGVPLHPERDGWHWLRYAGREPEPDRWNAAAQGWRYCGVLEYTSGPRVWSYVAPCPAPQDIEKQTTLLCAVQSVSCPGCRIGPDVSPLVHSAECVKGR